MKRKDIVTLAAGAALGTALVSGASAASGILAQPAWQDIYVDGQQVQMTAYNISGNNYVKLRDIGQAVGFNVYYQNGVQVDSKAPYTGAAPVQAQTQIQAQASQTASQGNIHVSSYKGSPIQAGDRSMLVISPYGGDFTVISQDPAIVSIDYVSGQWVAVANTSGTTTITVTDKSGGTGTLMLTVTPADPIDLFANMDIRLEMVRIINEVRRENGRSELPINESLMNAAQDVSAQCVSEHRPYDHLALIRYGWPCAGMYNLALVSMNGSPDIAREAVRHWINSPGHFQTMLMEEGSCLGAGITIKNGMAYCHMVVGDPTGHNPYE